MPLPMHADAHGITWDHLQQPCQYHGCKASGRYCLRSIGRNPRKEPSTLAKPSQTWLLSCAAAAS